MKELQQDAQLKQAKALKADGGLSEIKFHLFDVIDKSSVKALTDHLQKEHGDGVDFVINNAGIAMDGFGKSSTHGCTEGGIDNQWQTPTSSKRPSNATTTPPFTQATPSSP